MAPPTKKSYEFSVELSCRSGTHRLPSAYWLQKDVESKETKYVFVETNAFFESEDKSYYKKGSEMLEKRWTEYFSFVDDYVNE